MLVTDIDNLSIVAFEARHAGAILHRHAAAVERLDNSAAEAPILRVLNAAGGLRLDVDVLEFEILERRIGISAHCECLLRAGGPYVGNVDVAEVRQSLLT